MHNNPAVRLTSHDKVSKGLDLLYSITLAACRSARERSYCTSGPVSTGMDDHLRAGLPTPERLTRSTQPSISPGSLNRVPASLR